jgi:hypothetical protein
LVKQIRDRWEVFIQENGLRDGEGSLVYGHRMIAELGAKGLASLLFLTENGDREAAKYLVDRFLGMPEQPFSVQIAAKSSGETAELIKAEIVRMKLTPESAEAFVDRARQAALESHEEER